MVSGRTRLDPIRAHRQPFCEHCQTILTELALPLACVRRLDTRAEKGPNFSYTLKEGERGTVNPRVPYDRVSLDVSLTAMPRQVA